MDEVISYKGHSIRLIVNKLGRNKFDWTFQIDDGPVTQCRDKPLNSEAMAHDEGLAEAKWTVERIPVPYTKPPRGFR